MKATTERPPSFWRNPELRSPTPESRSILAKALFGENSYLILKALHHSDWAAQDFKIGNGFLWLFDSKQDALLKILEHKLRAQF